MPHNTSLRSGTKKFECLTSGDHPWYLDKMIMVQSGLSSHIHHTISVAFVAFAWSMRNYKSHHGSRGVRSMNSMHSLPVIGHSGPTKSSSCLCITAFPSAKTWLVSLFSESSRERLRGRFSRASPDVNTSYALVSCSIAHSVQIPISIPLETH